MSRFLLDTNIVSLYAPDRPPMPQAVAAWFDANDMPNQLFISAVTLAEIARGAERARRTGATQKSAKLFTWLDQLEAGYSETILPLDKATARIAGRLDDHAQSIGRNPGLADILIAATAEAHGLILATANTKHFQPLGIDFVNPFEASGL